MIFIYPTKAIKNIHKDIYGSIVIRKKSEIK